MALRGLIRHGNGSTIPRIARIFNIMSTNASVAHRWTARELCALPAEQRDAILREAAELARKDYINDLELTDFEAFGKDDIYGESSNAEAR